MDNWFDDLARSLAGEQSRRAVLRRLGAGLAGAVVAALVPGRALAKKNGQGTKHDPGARACVEFCRRMFPPGEAREVCIEAAAKGEGPCYDCGPKAPPPNHRVPCRGACCRPGEQCREGVCVCPSNRDCGKLCCRPDEVCSGTTCVKTCGAQVCAPGQACCPDAAGGRTCTDLKTNPRHCGRCGRACRPGFICRDGECVLDCPTARVCGERCCREGQVCSDERCFDPCGPDHFCRPDQVCCNTAGLPPGCADLEHDERNCGACGHACAPGETCEDGRCLPCPTNRVCGTEQLCCRGDRVCVGEQCVNTCGAEICRPNEVCCRDEAGARVCTDLAADPKHCGRCGKDCDDGKICRDGECVSPS